MDIFDGARRKILIAHAQPIAGRNVTTGQKSTVSGNSQTASGHVPEKVVLEHSLMSQQDIGIRSSDKMIRIVYFATGSMEGSIVRGFLFKPRVRTHSTGSALLAYPKANIVYARTLTQKGIGESQLFESLDSLGLNSIGPTSRCLIGLFIEDSCFDSESREIAPCSISTFYW